MENIELISEQPLLNLWLIENYQKIRPKSPENISFSIQNDELCQNDSLCGSIHTLDGISTPRFNNIENMPKQGWNKTEY